MDKATNIHNIVLIGPMGAGKTSIGKALARATGWDFYDSDQVVEERAGVDLLWIYDLEGEEGFHRREVKVIKELMEKPNIILASGGSTVAIPENREAIKASGLVVYLQASLKDQVIRTGYSNRRPLSSELEERRIILEKLHDEYVPLYEEIADIIYSTVKKPTNAAVAEIVEAVKSQVPSFSI